MYSAEKKADGHDKLEYVSSRKVTIEEDGINVKKKKESGKCSCASKRCMCDSAILFSDVPNEM